MTLIELLVVVAIIGLLAVTVLPNVANTAESRRGREATRVLSSYIAKAQARAFGRREWSGFTLVPLGNTGSQGLAVADLYLADVPAVYRGDTTPATLTVTASTAETQTLTPSPNALQNVAAQKINAFDMIRFDGRGPWYELRSAPTTTSISIRLLGSGDFGTAENLGFEAHNTPWPAGGTPHAFEIMRQPVPSGSPIALEGGRVVDLYWSGFGPPFVVNTNATFTDSYQKFSMPGQRITILFDGTGRLRQIVGSNSSTGSPRWVPTGPVFLLVGRADRVVSNPFNTNDPNLPNNLNAADDTTGANFQYPDSFWIGIDVTSGVCKTAECKRNPGGATDMDKLIDSQSYIRQALLKGGL